MPSARPSRYPSSLRASCSASTSPAVSVMLGRHPFGNRQLGNLDAGPRALARDALQPELTARSIDRAEPLVHVAQPDAVAKRPLQPLLAHPQAIVVDLDDGVALAERGADRDAPAADLPGEPVLDGVLDRSEEHTSE